jgi:tetratricopeptide (TPR) repeat protein
MNIHGLDNLPDVGGAISGVLVLRFSDRADAGAVNTLAAQLAESGVIDAPARDGDGDRSSSDLAAASPAPPGRGRSVVAFSWRVPAPEQTDEQRAALAATGSRGVAEIWGFASDAAADLADWFAPRWRQAPPSAPVSGSVEISGLEPAAIGWEGVGLTLRFGDELGDDGLEVVRALAGLWLSAYADPEASGGLGGRCYRRAVVEARDPREVIVGAAGIANPGTAEQAAGHLRWLASQIAAVLPLEAAEHTPLLPAPGDAAAQLAPATTEVRPERPTMEWREDAFAAVEEVERTAPETLEPESLDVDLADDGWDAEPATQQISEVAELAEGSGTHEQASEEPAEALAEIEEVEEVEELEVEELDEPEPDEPEPEDELARERAAEIEAEALRKLREPGREERISEFVASADEPEPEPEVIEPEPEVIEPEPEPEVIKAEVEPEPELEVIEADADLDDGDGGDDGFVSLDLGSEIELDSDLEAAMDAALVDSDADEPEVDDADESELVVAIRGALEAGDFAAAYTAFDRSRPGGEARREAGEIFASVVEDFDMNDFEELAVALELARRAAAAGCESSEPHLLAMRGLCRLGRSAEAIEIGDAHRDRPDVLVELFEILCVNKRTGDALGLLPALAASGHSGVGDHYYNLGVKLHNTHLDVALALYRGAIACGSPLPQAEINAGIAMLGAGDDAGVVALTRPALERHPAEPNLWANLIDAQLRADPDGVGASLESAVPVIGNSIRCDECDAESPAACGIGCGALLADCIGAYVALRRPDAALNLLELVGAGDAEAAIPQVVTARATALAAAGDIDGAAALLDRGLDVPTSTSFHYYHARANLAFARGEHDRAVGLLAAAQVANRRALELVQSDPVAALIAERGLSRFDPPIRPPSVPESARWVPGDREWAEGVLDGDGAKHGPYRFYRPDGTLCNECVFEHGKPHGPFKRFHESGAVSQEGAFEGGDLHGTRVWLASDVTTSEDMHGEHVSPVIRRSEMDYAHGRVTEVRHFDGEGRLCAHDGTPYPDRPEGVPRNAFYRSERDQWVAGEVDAEGQRTGTWQTWSSNGALLEESEFAAGKRHGSFRAFFADGTAAVEGTYDDGEKTGVFTYWRHAGDEHEDFPIAGPAIVSATESHDTYIPGVALFNAEGAECSIDGIALERWTAEHPQLAEWFDALWQIGWSEIEDASESGHRVPHLLLGLLAENEDLSDHVYTALYWHLCHQGTVYPATAAAIPFMMTLCQYERTPNLPALLNFLRNTGAQPAATLEEAAAEGHDAIVDCHAALTSAVEIFITLLEHREPMVRALASTLVAAAYDRADEMAGVLSSRLGREDSEMVRTSFLFSLARLASADAMFVVDAQLASGSPLVATAAALALVMARGEQSGQAVADRLVSTLVGFSDEMAETYAESPWADEHLVTEIAQALSYGTPGDEALDRLCAAMPEIASPGGLAVVSAALLIAIHTGDGGLTDELKKVLGAIAGSDNLWLFGGGEAITSVLEGFELPTDRAELAGLAV